MLYLALSLAFLQSPAEDALNRYAAYAKSTNVFSVDLKITKEGYPDAGVGRFLYEDGKRYRFAMKFGNKYDYEVVQTSRGQFEREGSTKTYDYFPGVTFDLPESDISPVPAMGFPHVLLENDLRNWMRENITFGGSQTVNGLRTDQVLSTVVELPDPSAMGGGVEKIHYYAAYIDDAGHLARFDHDVKIKDKSVYKIVQSFSHYKLNPLWSDADFPFAIPKGFTPYTLEREASKLGVNKKMPLGMWKGAKGETVSLADKIAGKPALIVITGDDPSMEPNIDGFLKGLKGVNLIRCTTSKSPRLGCLYDPSGKQLESWGMPGTPIFYLVDGAGNIDKMWYGYSSGEAAKFLKQVTDAYRLMKPAKP